MADSACTCDRKWLTRRGLPALDSPSMTHFFATVLASLAAAAVFTLSIPADAATAEWEIPFSVNR